jgi:hypothetical protein
VPRLLRNQLPSKKRETQRHQLLQTKKKMTYPSKSN